MSLPAKPKKDREPPARERILRCAHDLFYADGIRATGIDRVIAQSRVTKVTFYRSFPSKTDLIHAYLDYRHQRWMSWLRESLAALAAQGLSPLDQLVASFEQWWSDGAYRGCAFINSAVELGTTDAQVLATARRHKDEMTAELEALLPSGPQVSARAQALALAIDGAIVHVQLGEPPTAASKTLRLLLEPLFESI